MQTFTVLMGVSGAGKSTWFADHPKIGERCTFDAIRRPGVPAGPVIASVKKRARKSAAQGRSLVADACNLSANHRAWWLNLAEEFRARTVLVVVHPPELKVLRARQAARGVEAVPFDVVGRQLRQWPAALVAVGREPWGHVEHVGGRLREPVRVSSREW